MRKQITAVILAITVLTTSNTSYASGKLSEDEVYAMAEEVGAKYNICPELLQAMAFKESSYIPTVSNGSCIGLMQISENCHRDRMKRLGVTDLRDARQNMEVAGDLLSELFEKYGEASYVLDMYNGNSHAKSNYENGTLSKYAKGVLELSEQLEREHGK